MKQNGSPKAKFKTDDLRLWFLVELPIHPPFVGEAAPPVTEQIGTKLELSRHQVEILAKCREETSLVDLMTIADRKDRTKFRQQVLSPLLDETLIEMTIPTEDDRTGDTSPAMACGARGVSLRSGEVGSPHRPQTPATPKGASVTPPPGSPIRPCA